MGFTITSCVLSGVMLISYAFALSFVSPSRYQYYGYSDVGLSYGRYYEAATAMFAVFVVVSVAEFFISLASSIYCCNAVCSTNGAVV